VRIIVGPVVSNELEGRRVARGLATFLLWFLIGAVALYLVFVIIYAL
jgi:hypothetical protein